MARRKIVFVVVEGPSDEEALGAVITRIFDESSVFVKIMRCDITTEKGINAGNIISKVGNVIRLYAKDNHFTKNDFKRIIHITDMDGAYISNENIVENTESKKPVYSENKILTRDKQGIEERNEQKRTNLNRLCGCDEIWNVPYRIFYMSCNLDHVLYNKLNSSDEEKENDSFRFAKKYKDKTTEFLSFISESSFSVVTDYKDSWEYIKKDLHSLERHSNLGLCFKNDD